MKIIESKPIVEQSSARRFALGVSLFYGSTFGVIGTYLPFFPVWLKAIGIDAAWIGIIAAAPSLSRFTILPFVTAFVERRQILRGTMILMAFATGVGFAVLGFLHQPLAILVVFILTAFCWTPLGPLTDGYALKGVVKHDLNYGPLRLWGSAAFIVGAVGCGALAGVIQPQHLIWVIVAVTVLSALVSLGLAPLEVRPAGTVSLPRASALLRKPLFLAIIGAAALIQGSHSAYYVFASIAWQNAGLGGLTIAGLWSLGVLAEIVVFAISPRLIVSPTILVIIGALSAVLRWTMMAQEPSISVLTPIQLLHGLTFGITHVGTVALLARSVPHHILASAQGYLAASIGIVTSLTVVLSGMIYAQVGGGVYDVMAIMAFAGGVLMVFARGKLDARHAVMD